ncbi:MAG: hypothetical protein HKN44_07075 [Ilumatobacter sp.]|nr:hypothetical protein [Ilumatobacter sp.]
MSSNDPFGRWKQRTYPWASNAPPSDDHAPGPARGRFWVIPALFFALVGIFVLLLVFAPDDPPPPGGSPGLGGTAQTVALVAT